MVKSWYDVRAVGIGRPFGDGDDGGRGGDEGDHSLSGCRYRCCSHTVRNHLLPRVVQAFPPLGARRRRRVGDIIIPGGGNDADPIGTIVVAGYRHGRRHDIFIMRLGIQPVVIVMMFGR